MARPEKTAVVDEIRAKLTAADAAVLTEYRGLTVGELAELRGALRPAGTEYKVFKNTLARRGAEEAGLVGARAAARGPRRDRVRPGRRGGRRQGPARLRPQQPRPGREGRAARRAASSTPGDDRRRSPTSPPARGAARAARRRLPGAAGEGRRPVPGLHPQLRLRLQGADRPARRAAARRSPAPRPPTTSPRQPTRSRRPTRRPRPRRRGRRRRGARRRPAESADDDRPEPEPETRRPQIDTQKESTDMATMSTDELLDVFKNMTVLELNEFLKEFEEEFGVTAAAPVAVAAAAGWRRWRRAPRRRGEGRVRRRPRRRRRQEDPGHQGGPVAHEPRAEGGQGPRRLRPEARPREGRPRKTPRRRRRPSRAPAPPSSSSRAGARSKRSATSGPVLDPREGASYPPGAPKGAWPPTPLCVGRLSRAIIPRAVSSCSASCEFLALVRAPRTARSELRLPEPHPRAQFLVRVSSL